ncbi:pentatricopeptide repeat-containing protein At4g35130, chloroplastic [Lactuca sativa]|uniref:pentatricopeptide repeat-containing protein At4g35130, chloroplastic n=1 Tax=Lactuca sativa TaxID=4236 RepID=UPI000CCB5634|nr:pentatricopeptide repeat-containing protein At4g35130, chloroplastic [Lactuca sativa]
MTTILSLNSSFKFAVNENKARRGRKRASEFINQYDPIKQKISNSVRSKSSITKTSSSRQMEHLVSYVEDGSVENALQLFDEMNKRSTFVWNIVIRALTNNGYFKEALKLYLQMCIEGVQPDKFTFPFVIKACGGCLDLVTGKKVHSNLFKFGLISDFHVSNSLILMYAKVGHIGSAEKVFDEMPVRDLVSWNSMINAYLFVNNGLTSLTCFSTMQQSGIKPDRFTIVSALHASSLIHSLPNGKQIHAIIIKTKSESNEMIQTSLIDMYVKCNAINYAERFFNLISPRHVAPWNAMIRGYNLNNQPLESFSCLKKMQENRINPDVISLINFLPSCSQLQSMISGKTIHGYAIRLGFLPHIFLETALIDMYGKCGNPRLSETIFDQMDQRNLISRNTMIDALVKNGRYQDALKIFRDIWDHDLKPDPTTITMILDIISDIAGLREGKQIHGYVIKSGFYSNTFVLNSLVYMYAKCGDLDSGRVIFDRILTKDIVSWNTIILANGFHGFGEISVNLFLEMIRKGIKPNSSTFFSVLSACSFSGMVEEGWKFFTSMKPDYGIDPGIEHYGCILDLLARIGDLDRAKRVITEMPLEPTSRIWGSLLGASRKHRDLELAEFVANRVLSCEHDNTDHTGLYVLLSNLYAEMGRWEDVRRVKSLMESQRLRKTDGLTLVEVKGETFRFMNGDRSHKDSNLIYKVLDVTLENCYGDLCKFKPVDFLQRRSKSTDWHSVRLAVCFGLISTTIGKPVIVRKNVRICEDCHCVMKKISLTCQREIVVGDSKIFHHFRHGRCSCHDYW